MPNGKTISVSEFPVFVQSGIRNCGPSCLKILTDFYNQNYSIENLEKLCGKTVSGTTMLNLKGALIHLGFACEGFELKSSVLLYQCFLPCIILWRNSHYSVLYRINKRGAYISDPAKGIVEYTTAEFENGWLVKNNRGIALMVFP